MWIRSQFKETLIDVNDIRVIPKSAAYNPEAFIGDGEWTIQGVVSTATFHDVEKPITTCVNLGMYSTREKAFKILDDIQNFLVGSDIRDVYQMPKDDDEG